MKIKQPTKWSRGGKIAACVVALLAAAFFLRWDPFLVMQAESLAHAGTWEDDPKNWYRAFHEEPPAEIKVVHSKYWRSSHFTYEYIYHFEVEASPEWRDKFLAKHKLERVPQKAEEFGANMSNDTPRWFAAASAERYEAKDEHVFSGSVWINQANGHIFINDKQL